MVCSAGGVSGSRAAIPVPLLPAPVLQHSVGTTTRPSVSAHSQGATRHASAIHGATLLRELLCCFHSSDIQRTPHGGGFEQGPRGTAGGGGHCGDGDKVLPKLDRRDSTNVANATRGRPPPGIDQQSSPPTRNTQKEHFEKHRGCKTPRLCRGGQTGATRSKDLGF